jgi:uncharacterized protein HemX
MLILCNQTGWSTGDKATLIAAIIAGCIALLVGIVQVISNLRIQKQLKERDEKLAKELQSNAYEQEYFRGILKKRIDIIDKINKCFNQIEKIDVDDLLNDDLCYNLKNKISKLSRHNNLWLFTGIEFMLRHAESIFDESLKIQKDEVAREVKYYRALPLFRDLIPLTNKILKIISILFYSKF